MTDLEQIGVGSTPNDNTGDPLRDGGIKINNNFIKLEKVRRIVFSGELQIYKGIQNGLANISIESIEPNDAVSGWISESIFIIFGQYISGDTSSLLSYNQDSINYTDLNDNEI